MTKRTTKAERIKDHLADLEDLYDRRQELAVKRKTVDDEIMQVNAKITGLIGKIKFENKVKRKTKPKPTPLLDMGSQKENF